MKVRAVIEVDVPENVAKVLEAEGVQDLVQGVYLDENLTYIVRAPIAWKMVR